MKTDADLIEYIKTAYLTEENKDNSEILRIIKLYINHVYPEIKNCSQHEIDNIKHLIDTGLTGSELIPLLSLDLNFQKAIREPELEEYMQFLLSVEALFESSASDQIIKINFKNKLYGFDEKFNNQFINLGISFLEEFLDVNPQLAFLWKFIPFAPVEIISNYTKYLILNDVQLIKKLNDSGLRSSKGQLFNNGSFNVYESQITKFLKGMESHLILNNLKSINKKFEQYATVASIDAMKIIDDFLLTRFNFANDDQIRYNPKTKILTIPNDNEYSGISRDVFKIIARLYSIRLKPEPFNQLSFRELLPSTAKSKLRLDDFFSSKNARFLKANRMKKTDKQKWYYFKS